MQARFKAEPQIYNLVNNDQCTAFSIAMAAFILYNINGLK